jgi:hypothetical protein
MGKKNILHGERKDTEIAEKKKQIHRPHKARDDGEEILLAEWLTFPTYSVDSNGISARLHAIKRSCSTKSC